MTKTTRARYTLEFKREAVRLVEGGQSIAAAARIATRQVEASLVLLMPALERILRRVAQLQLLNGRPYALAQLDVELYRSDAVFV